MQITILTATLSLIFAVKCNQNNLYIIADVDDKVNQVYPQITITTYHDGRQVKSACFLSRKVNLFSPYCFSTDQVDAELVNNLKEIQGEIWDQEKLDDFLVKALLRNGQENRFVNVTENDLPGCAGLLTKYTNVFLLIKKEGYYEKVRVTACTSFEE